MKTRNDGFTLVELMVVVLVIGILVAIATPVFNAARGDSETKTCLANQRMILGAVETFQATTGAPLDINYTGWGGWGVFISQLEYPAKWTYSGDRTYRTDQRFIPDYLKSVPRCPAVVAQFAAEKQARLSSQVPYSYELATYVLKRHSPTDTDVHISQEVALPWADSGWVTGHTSLSAY